jgi:hypothetical protein
MVWNRRQLHREIVKCIDVEPVSDDNSEPIPCRLISSAWLKAWLMGTMVTRDHNKANSITMDDVDNDENNTTLSSSAAIPTSDDHIAANGKRRTRAATAAAVAVNGHNPTNVITHSNANDSKSHAKIKD